MKDKAKVKRKVENKSCKSETFKDESYKDESER